MNVKSTILGIFGAAVITMSMIGGASAGNTTTADVSVKVGQPDNGVLSASITGGAFDAVKYRAGNGSQDSRGKVVITATDTRGLGTGWTVTLQANGDFSDGAKSFSVNNFSLQPGSLQGADNANANGITAQAIGGITTSGQNVLVAQQGKGLGVFTNTIDGTIKVPDGTLVGDYKTTLTVAITAGQ
jgi:hypothetical protein